MATINPVLAAELSKLTSLPVVDDCLIRQRHVPPQAKTLTVAERRGNVANAFTCRNHRLQAKQVLLIDDVSTSGATLDACATTLKAARGYFGVGAGASQRDLTQQTEE